MTIAEQWKQDGRIEGRQAILQRLVTKRFGQNILDLQFQERLQKATPEQLDLWAEKLLDAKNIDESTYHRPVGWRIDKFWARRQP